MWRLISRPWPVIAALAFLSGCSGYSHVERADAIDIDKTLVAAVSDQLVLDIPAGDVDIEPSGDDKLHVTMTFYCAPDSEKCRQLAEDAEIIHSRSEKRSTISFRPDSALATRHAEVAYLFEVPPTEHVTINMSAGELDATRLESCLSAFVGAGDVSITQPASSVRSVTLDANVGDATLHHSDGAADTRRKLLVGAEISWSGGSGHCDNRVKLQAGDISYFLE